MISHDRLCELVKYCPDTGAFTWAKTRKKCTKGAIAGSSRADGYVLIRLDYKRYYAHRLAWLYMTGDWPAMEIDHADGNPANNSWANLRAATSAQNMQNRRVQKNNGLGVKGVRRTCSGYYSSIKANGSVRYLGHFRTLDEARDAYEVAAKHYFGEFARVA